MAPWRPRHAIRHPTTIHAGPQSHNREQARSETVDTISQKHAQYLSSSRVTQSGPEDSAKRQSDTGYRCNVQGVTMCSRSLKQTAISLSSCEAEFSTASACARDPSRSRRTLPRTSLGTLQFVSKWIQIRHVAFYSEEDREDSSTLKIRCLAVHQWIMRETFIGWTREHERQHRRSLYETSGWTENGVALKETWTSNPGRHL